MAGILIEFRRKRMIETRSRQDSRRALRRLDRFVLTSVLAWARSQSFAWRIHRVRVGMKGVALSVRAWRTGVLLCMLTGVFALVFCLSLVLF